MIRATGLTWDTVWRDDLVAWALTMALVAALVAAAIPSVRAGVVPSGEDRHAGLPAFVVWPYLYLVLFYAQSAAYVDSSAGVVVAIGIAVAIADAALAVVVLAVIGRRGLSPPVAAATTVALVGLAYALSFATGVAAIATCGAVQVAAAALFGAVAGARGVESTRPGIGRTSFAFAAGSLLFAVATLAYTIHPLQPLPVSNSFVPAVVALSMLVAVRARPDRPEPMGPATVRLVRSVVLALVALAVVVPVLIAVTWPSAPVTTAAGRPIQVMTCNIDEASPTVHSTSRRWPAPSRRGSPTWW